MAFSLGEYQDLFLEEADDQLHDLNKNLLELEKNYDDQDTINEIFRTAHSLKSSAAFVGLNDLSDLAHKMENLLQGIRDKTMAVSSDIINLLFKCFDTINAVIESVANEREPDQDLVAIIREVEEMSRKSMKDHESTDEGGAIPGETKTSPQTEVQKICFNADEKKALKKGVDAGYDCYQVNVYIEKDSPMKWVKAHLIFENLKGFAEIIKTVPAEDELSDENIGDYVQVIFITPANKDEIRKACDVDLVKQVDIVKISLVKKQGKYVLTFHKKETFKEETSLEEEGASQPEEAAQVVEPVVEQEETVVIPEKNNHETKEKVHAERRAPVLRTVKVSVDKLDELLNNVGELVIANSGFYRLYDDLKKVNADKSHISEFKTRMEQMSRIAKDLQSGIMKTRMVPIGQAFDRFHRLVRDLSKEVGKPVELVTQGEETELDKKVIDVIGEPLMHLIRNSIDHGIESVEERRKAKKADVGTVKLNAHQGGNQIFVEVSDDGKGLDIDQIKKKALQKKIVTPEVLANLDDNEILEFIFSPGFSTAAEITDLSGRGVGMNVVKQVVSEMNGSVSIESEPGMGTCFIMTFPLTLAIIPAIMVKVRQEMYAVPLSDVIETIKIPASEITTIEGHEVLNLRGELLSLLRLNQFVGVPSALDDQTKIPVIVVGFGNRKIGLIVDELQGKLEIVIKSLEQNYRTVEGLAGASILGDGSICLILDISSMITKVINEQEKLTRENKWKAMHQTEVEVETHDLIDLEEQFAQKRAEEEAIRPEEQAAKGAESHVLFVETPPEEITPEPESIIEEKIPERRVEETGSVEQIESAEEPRVEAAGKIEEIEVKEEIISPQEEVSSVAMPQGDQKYEAIEKEKELPSIDITDKEQDQITPVEEKGSSFTKQDDEVHKQVKDVLNTFREELHHNIVTSLENARPDDHIKKSLNITDEDLNKVQLLANVGITQSAESLSQIIKKTIELSIPAVQLLPLEKIVETIGNIDDVYLGVYMPLAGDLKGTILLSLPEKVGFSMIDDLFGLQTGQTHELTEDGESALKEITNIVGSAVINGFSEKTGMSILASVPTIVHDYMQSIIDSILIIHNLANDYALIMETEFFYQDDRVVGNLLILPETESLKNVINHLREG